MFTELNNICGMTGLEFSEQKASLYGELSGFGVTVTDTGDEYKVRIFCEKPYERENEVFPIINALGESLPKNTISKQSCEYDHICIVTDKYSLVQENIVYLAGFLDKLAQRLGECGFTGKAYSFPRERRSSDDTAAEPGQVRVKLGFDRHSILGLVGAVTGAAAMTVIAILLVDANAEAVAFGLSFEISAYILSGLTGAVIFADYRFLARKLDACGVIVCPVLSAIATVLSGLGAGVKAFASLFGVSFMQSLRNLPQYFAEPMEYSAVVKFVTGYITRGLVFSVLVSIIICVWYFERHPDETVLSEKVRDKSRDGIDGILGKK